MRTSGLRSKALPLAMEPAMVRAVGAPKSMAPKNSQTAAMMTACHSLRALLPTEVPKLLATSFAPIPGHKTKAFL